MENQEKKEMKNLSIRVIAEEKNFIDKATGKQKTFTAYKAIQKDGSTITCKFKKEATNVPKTSCMIIVSPDKCNIDNTKQYPVLWVQEVKETREFDNKKRSYEKLMNSFEIADEDLPF